MIEFFKKEVKEKDFASKSKLCTKIVYEFEEGEPVKKHLSVLEYKGHSRLDPDRKLALGQ